MSGVALAMRHRLQWFIHLWAQGLRKGDGMAHFTITIPLSMAKPHESCCAKVILQTQTAINQSIKSFDFSRTERN